jgi:sugar phosphate isomerase/epimerase
MAAEVGFDGLVASVGSHLVPQADDATFAERLNAIRALPLPVVGCNSFLPGNLRVTGPDADHTAIERYAAVVFARAERAGVSRIVFGSADARRVPDGYSMDRASEQFASLLRRLAPRAADHGITLLPETLNRKECNFLTRMREILPIIASVDHPAVRLTADLYHMRVEGDGPQDLAKALPWLAHVEIAEVARRTAPGIEGDDFRPFFAILKAHGWRGPLNVEGQRAEPAQYRAMFPFLAAQWQQATA